MSARLVCMTNQVKVQQTGADLRRTAAVAADYTQLQGLINVTTGIGLGLWAFGWGVWAAVVMGVGVAVWSGYYRRRFGGAVGRGSLLGSLVAVGAAFVVCMVGLVLDRLAVSPVLLLPLLAAACFVVGYRIGFRHVGVTWAHWAAVALLVLSAFSPLVGLDVLGPHTGVLVLGVAMAVMGIADHLRLVAAMKPVPHD